MGGPCEGKTPTHDKSIAGTRSILIHQGKYFRMEEKTLQFFIPNVHYCVHLPKTITVCQGIIFCEAELRHYFVKGTFFISMLNLKGYGLILQFKGLLSQKSALDHPGHLARRSQCPIQQINLPQSSALPPFSSIAFEVASIQQSNNYTAGKR